MAKKKIDLVEREIENTAVDMQTQGNPYCKHQNQAEENGQIKCLDCNQLT